MNAIKILKITLVVGLSLLVLNWVSPIKSSQATNSASNAGKLLVWNYQPGLLATEQVEAPDCHPNIDIRKQEEGPDLRQVSYGLDVHYEIVVTNTGDVPLSNVEVTDDHVTDCNRSIGDLAVGEYITYTCTMLAVTESFTNTAYVEGEANGIVVWDKDPSSVEVITPYNITVGFEDLKLVKESDFDYNDWVVSIETNLQGVYLAEDEIFLEGITFTITPTARGAALGHEFYFRIITDTFSSNYDAKLVIQDIEGSPLKTEIFDDINPSKEKDFLINFDISTEAHSCDCEAFADHQNAQHNLRVTDEDNVAYNNPARRKAELSIVFDTPFVFNRTDYGIHCEDLFFDPHLHVNAAEPYEVSWITTYPDPETRIICVKDKDWEWPEERIRVDRAYPIVEWLGEPTFFEFWPNWYEDHNTCVFDGQPCVTSILYLPMLTK